MEMWLQLKLKSFLRAFMNIVMDTELKKEADRFKCIPAVRTNSIKDIEMLTLLEFVLFQCLRLANTFMAKFGPALPPSFCTLASFIFVLLSNLVSLLLVVSIVAMHFVASFTCSCPRYNHKH